MDACFCHCWGKFFKIFSLFCQAHDLQHKVVCRVINEHSAELQEQRKLLASICCDWAREFHLIHDLEMAKQRYTDALHHSPDDEEVSHSVSACAREIWRECFTSHLLDLVHTQIIFHLAQLYYEHQKLDYSGELCEKILQLRQNHTAASMVWIASQRRSSANDVTTHVCVFGFVLSCWLIHYSGRTRKGKRSRFMLV